MIMEAMILVDLMCERKFKVYDDKGTEITTVSESQAADFLTSLGLGYKTNILTLMRVGDVHNINLGHQAIPRYNGDTLNALSLLAVDC